MSSLVDLLNEHTPLERPFGRFVVVLALFAVAWLFSRGANRLATFIVTRSERMSEPRIEDSGVIASLKQRETAISLARTGVRLVVYTLAALLSLGVLLGADRVETIAGASFVVILVAFAAQRFLVDHALHPSAGRRRGGPPRGRPPPDTRDRRGPLGREWLAEDLLPNLVRERAADDLLVHGPVVMYADEQAERRFARAIRTPLVARGSAPR